MSETELKLFNYRRHIINYISTESLTKIPCLLNNDILNLLSDYLEDIVDFYYNAEDFIDGDISPIDYKQKRKNLKEIKKESRLELKNIWKEHNPNINFNSWFSYVNSNLHAIMKAEIIRRKTVLYYNEGDIVDTRFGRAKILVKRTTSYLVYFFDYKTNRETVQSEILGIA